MQILTILVTGGAGFIGSHSVDLLLAAGHRVIVLDNLSSGKASNLTAHANLTFIQGDILDAHLLGDLIPSCDAVLHLAAISSVTRSIEDPAYTAQVNTQGLIQLLNFARQHQKRVVYASSAAVYGNQATLPCRESFPKAEEALSPYALQKIQCEEYAHLFARLYGSNVLGLRYFNVYGPKQDPQSVYAGVISRFVEAAFTDQPIVIYGGGEQSRDFIYVGDIARANLLALQSTVQGVLNVSTGEPHTLLELIQALQKIMGQSLNVTHAAARIGDIKSSYGDPHLALQQLGFSAEISFEQGLRRLIDHCRLSSKSGMI